MLLLILTHLFLLDSIKAQQCGGTTENLSGKIVGGYDIGYYKYPWFAALTLDGVPWCGGTYIGNDVVLTAAHCYREYLHQQNADLTKVFKVMLGVYRSCKNETTQRIFKVKKVIVHEDYLKNQPYYDIALLLLDGNATSFEPCCLPPKVLSDKEKGHEGFIIGLGTIKYGVSKYPCEVREGRVLLYSDKICRDMIKNTTDTTADYSMTSAFCAGYKEGGVDACQGDSGGPLLIMGPNNRYIVVGITSFGYDCAKKDMMGIYTDVSKYNGWIEKHGGVKQSVPEPSTEQPPEVTNQTVTQSALNQTEAITETPVVSQEVPIEVTSPSPSHPGHPSIIVNGNNQSFPFWWPPKRIIIEYRKGRKSPKPSHKKATTKHHKKKHNHRN